MEFVKITQPGNRPDRIMYGCVPYEYEIAKCQLSNAEWCEFLNAVEEKWERCEKCEGCEKLGLWHKDMESGVLGGIARSRTSGQESASPLFTVKPGWEKKPVVYVDYLSLCRYCNWLTSGDIERGSYDLSGDMPKRVVGAKYFLPNDAEWYKAAYYDCSIVRLFGLFDWILGKGGYWNYPTQSNEIPTQDQVNFERGDCLSPLALTPQSNNQTIKQSNNSYYYLTDVDAYADHPSPWGVLQMGGNAWEMLEDVAKLKGCKVEKLKGCGYEDRWLNTYRGGSFGYTETGLSKFNCDTAPYNGRCYVFGARIARMESGWRPLTLPLQYGIMQQTYKFVRGCKRFVRKLLFLARS